LVLKKWSGGAARPHLAAATPDIAQPAEPDSQQMGLPTSLGAAAKNQGLVLFRYDMCVDGLVPPAILAT
jgi:hypothetical protein